MKKLFAIIGIIFGIAVSSCLAQDAGDQKPDGGKLEALKIGFLTNKLNLSPEEAERFWPIYRQYSAESHQVQLAYRDNKDELKMEEAMLNIRKRYSSEFLKALSPDKVNLFFRYEKDFSNFVRKELIQRRQERMQQRRPLLR